MRLLVALPFWMQGDLFSLKVRDDFGKQAQRQLIVNRVACLPILEKQAVDRFALVAHGGTLNRTSRQIVKGPSITYVERARPELSHR